MIQLVFAHNKGAFGTESGMPWPHIKKDMQEFAKTTKDTVMVMGAKTFASFDRKLSGRLHYVVYDPSREKPVTKNGEVADHYIPTDWLKTYLLTIQESPTMYSVIGGVNLLEQAIDFADRIVYTSIMYKGTKNEFDVTAELSSGFLYKIDTFSNTTEEHYYRIDENCSILQTVKDKYEYYR